MSCGTNINIIGSSSGKHGKLIISGANNGTPLFIDNDTGEEKPFIFDATKGNFYLDVSSGYDNSKQAVVVERVNKNGEVDNNGRSLLAKFYLQKPLQLRVEAYVAAAPEASIEETEEFRILKIGIPSGVVVEEETTTLNGDGISNIFHLPVAFAPKSLKIWCNGVAQAPELGYIVTGANTFQTNWIPSTEELLLIRYIPNI